MLSLRAWGVTRSPRSIEEEFEFVAVLDEEEGKMCVKVWPVMTGF